MDPNACLRDIEELVRDEKDDEAKDCCADLAVWLAGEGFEPEWWSWPLGFEFFKRWLMTDDEEEVVE